MATDFISIPLDGQPLELRCGAVTVAVVHDQYERFVSLLWSIFVKQASQVARFGSGTGPMAAELYKNKNEIELSIPLLFWIGRPELTKGTTGVSVLERIGAVQQCAEILSSLDALHCLRCGTQIDSQAPELALREAVEALAPTETVLVLADLAELQILELERSRASDVFESYGLERVIESGAIKRISEVFDSRDLEAPLNQIASQNVAFVLGTLPPGASDEDIRESLRIARNCSRQRVTLAVSEKRSVRVERRSISLERGCPHCGGEVVTSKMVRVAADPASVLRISSGARIGQSATGAILKSPCLELKNSIELPESLARLVTIMGDCGLGHVRLGSPLDSLTPTERVQLEIVQLLNDNFSDVLVLLGEFGILLGTSLLERIFEAISVHSSGVTTLVTLPINVLPQRGSERVDWEWSEVDRGFVLSECLAEREPRLASRRVSTSIEKATGNTEGSVTTVDVGTRAAPSTSRDTVASVLGLEEAFADRLAATIEARLRAFDRATFDPRRSPYRCEECGGAGVVASDAAGTLVPALIRFLTCPVCDGRRFTEEPLGVTFRGLSFDGFCRTPAEELLAPFSDAPKELLLARTLCRLGLGHLAVGTPILRLTPMEGVRLDLARAVVSLGKTSRASMNRGARSLHLSGVLEATSSELCEEIRGMLEDLGETGVHVRASA